MRTQYGAGVCTIVPAVPSPDGVADVFAFQNDGTVQAITSEGATAWTADITWAWGALPDFQGGLLTVEYDGETESLVRIHGATGQRTVLYSLVSAETNQWVTTVGVHTDGTVFAIRAGGAELERPAVVGIDGVAGGVKFVAPIGPQAEIVDDGPNIVPVGDTGVYGSAIIVAGDGYAYVPYAYQHHGGQPYVYDDHLGLLRISSSGAATETAIYGWTDRCMEGFAVGASTITNADEGILLSWTIGLYNGGYDHGMAVTSGTGAALLGAPGVTNQTGFAPAVQTQDGWLVGQAVDASENPYLLAIDASGGVHWAVSGLYQPKMATADGGVIATAEDGTAVIFDQTGTVTGQLASLPVQSWTGNAYQTTGATQQVVTNWLYLAASFWALEGGQYTRGTAAIPLDSIANEKVRVILSPERWQAFADSNCNKLFRNSAAALSNYSCRGCGRRPGGRRTSTMSAIARAPI
jgi:hypothetical protein